MSQLKDLSNFKIAVLTAIETKVPHLFKGAPGSAKTAALTSVFETLGGYIEPVLCSTLTPSDVLGFPYRDSAYTFQDEYGNQVNGALKFSPPYWALKALEAAAAKNPDGSKKYKFVCLFFDELYTATPAVQSALLRPLNEGFVGDLNIKHIIRIAAANGRGQSSGFSISQALENRFSNLNIFPDNKDWLNDFIIGTDEKETIEYTPFDNDYKSVLSEIYSQLIETNQVKLVEGDTVPPGAFPSKRSLSNLSKILKFCSQNNISSTFVREEIIGLVGAQYVSNFLSFYETIKEFNFEFPFWDYIIAYRNRSNSFTQNALDDFDFYHYLYGDSHDINDVINISEKTNGAHKQLHFSLKRYFKKCLEEKDKGAIDKANIKKIIKVFIALRRFADLHTDFGVILSKHTKDIESLVNVRKELITNKTDTHVGLPQKGISFDIKSTSKEERDEQLKQALSKIKIVPVSQSKNIPF